MKTCSRCKEDKSIDSFSNYRRGKDGKSCICKNATPNLQRLGSRQIKSATRKECVGGNSPHIII